MTTQHTNQTETDTLADRIDTTDTAPSGATSTKPRRKPRTSVVKLKAGHLACSLCGQSVNMDAASCGPVERFTSYARGVAPGADDLEQMMNERHGRETTLEFARCSDCLELGALAATILDEHPAVQARLGSRSVGLERVECALAALAALSCAQQAPRLTKTDGDLLRLLRLLQQPGASVRWAARLVPFTRWNADPAGCSAAPWSHLEYDPEAAANLRTAYARLLRERTERPQAYPCPTVGCVLCGVGAVTSLPTQAKYAWQGVTYRGAELHACRTCAEAITFAGVVGPTAVDRAVFEYLEVPLGARYGFGVKATAWADLPGSRTPNAAPWRHLGDLNKLARELGAQR